MTTLEEMEKLVNVEQAKLDGMREVLFKMREEERLKSIEPTPEDYMAIFRVLDTEFNGYSAIRRRDTGNSYDLVSVTIPAGLPDGVSIKIEFTKKRRIHYLYFSCENVQAGFRRWSA